MNELSAGTLEAIYFTVIAAFTALLVWNGWRQGVGRQLMTLIAIASAYAVGWFGSSTVAPLFTFLGYAAPITRIIAGAAAGLATFLALRTLRVLLFKRTADLKPGAMRTSYGVLGAAMGLIFGVILLFVTSDAIRLLGSLASTNVQMAEERKKEIEANPSRPAFKPDEPNIFVRGLAKLSNALDSGSTGQFLKRYDPVPTGVYATIAKLAVVVSREDSLERFLAYPGVEHLANNPKLRAVREDPEVEHLLAEHSYLKLLRHQKVVALANDPEFASEIKKVNFDDALDSALRGNGGM